MLKVLFPSDSHRRWALVWFFLPRAIVLNFRTSFRLVLVLAVVELPNFPCAALISMLDSLFLSYSFCSRSTATPTLVIDGNNTADSNVIAYDLGKCFARMAAFNSYDPEFVRRSAATTDDIVNHSKFYSACEQLTASLHVLCRNLRPVKLVLLVRLMIYG